MSRPPHIDPHPPIPADGAGLTVVIPVYQRVDQVGETLDSLAAQTVRPGEVILVDNGSTDGTLPLLHRRAEEMRQAGWKVRVLAESRSGAAAARQCGLEAVESPYVMFFDSDDIMPPTHIASALRDIATHPDCDLWAWGIGYESAGRRLGSRRVRPAHLLENHMVQGLLCTAAYVVRTATIRRAGGWNPDIGGWDDWELGLRLLLSGARVTVDPAPRLWVRVQESSISGLGYLHRAGDWERTLTAVEQTASGDTDPRRRLRLLRLVAYRRVNLAAHYTLEGRPDLGRELLRLALSSPALRRRHRLLLRMAYLHTSRGLPWAGGLYPNLL